MLIAERKGIRRRPSRSKRRSRITGYENAGFRSQCQCNRFPHDHVEFVVAPRKLRDCELAILLYNGGLGPRAAKRRPRREQQPKVFFRIPILDDVLGRGEQFRQFNERRDALYALFAQKRPAFLFGEPQRTLAGFIIHQ